MGIQNWATPPHFIRAVELAFHCQFDLDVCADAGNAKAARYITAEQDGLKQAWEAKCAWCNPGFGNMEPWLAKAIQECCFGETDRAFVLGLVAPSTKWWNSYGTCADEIVLLSPRVQFLPPPGVAKSSNPRECCLFIFEKRWKPLHIWTWQWEFKHDQ